MHELEVKDRVMDAFDRLFEPLDFEVRLGVKRLLLQWWPEIWTGFTDHDDLERLVGLMNALSGRLIRHLEAWQTRDGERRLRNDVMNCLSYTNNPEDYLLAKDALQKLGETDEEALICLMLKHDFGYTLEQMIELTGWTMQAIRTRLNRGREFLGGL